MMSKNTTNINTNNSNLSNDFLNVLGAKQNKIIKTEYLFLLNKKNGRFNDEESIKNLFKINSNIKFMNDKIKYNTLNINYTLDSEKLVNDEKQIYVHLEFTIEVSKETDKELDEYSNFLREIREIISKWDDSNEILWDGIGFFYAVQAYPLVYEIENLIRKLITKFMLKTIGRDWTKKYISQDIKNTLRKSESKTSNVNFLYNVDFKQLENFLFEKFSNEDKGQLYKLIESGKCEIGELKKFLPESNWNRLFSKLMTETLEEKLKENLSKLYELRCKVAHNNIIEKQDFNQIKNYHKYLKDNIEMAITKIGKIDKEEAKVIADSFGKFVPENEERELIEEILIQMGPAKLYCNYISNEGEIKIISFILGSLDILEYQVNSIQAINENLHIIKGNLKHEDITLKVIVEIFENMDRDILRIGKVEVIE